MKYEFTLKLKLAREADSAEEVIVNALIDIEKALPDAWLLEVSPDFVDLTDVAERVGVSRQSMRNCPWLRRSARHALQAEPTFHPPNVPWRALNRC